MEVTCTHKNKVCPKLVPHDQCLKIRARYVSFSMDQKHGFIFNFCERHDAATHIASRRSNTITYFLPDGTGARQQVCKSYFLTTIGKNPRSDRIIHYTLAKNQDSVFLARPHGMTDRPGNSRISPEPVDDHIKSYEPSTSHYRRAHAPKVLYLSSELSVAKMYSEYIEGGSGPKVSYQYYWGRVREMNISFTKLGCEQCEICDRYKVYHDPTISAADFEMHEFKYLEARAEYQTDKRLYGSLSPDEKSVVCVSVDLQKVILLPHLPHYKSCIFTSRLIVFNETFVPIGSSSLPVYAVIWHEATAGRSKEELASAYYSFFMRHKECPNLIIWLDNCSAQNKNWCLLTFLVLIVNSPDNNIQRITLKYFETGHTYMSADSFHHSVEQSIKQVHELNDYFEFTSRVQAAWHGNVNVKDMSCEDFYDWKDLSSPTKLKKNPEYRLQNMVSIEARRGEEKLFFKKRHTEEFKAMDFLQVKALKHGIPMPTPRNKNKCISSKKKKDIIDNLLKLMPENRHLFWTLLEESDTMKDLDLRSLFSE